MKMFENYRDEVKTYMEVVVRELKQKYGSLNATYKMPLIILAENLETFYKASDIVKEEGITVQGSRGLMEHPAQKIKDSVQIRIEKAISEFGLSPKSQKHLTAETDDTDDLIEALVNG